MQSALALQELFGHDGDEPIGALVVADMADDIRQIRRILEAAVGIKKHERKG